MYAKSGAGHGAPLEVACDSSVVVEGRVGADREILRFSQYQQSITAGARQYTDEQQYSWYDFINI